MGDTDGDLAVLGLEDREEPGLLGQPGHADRVARVRAPAERAGDEDVEVAGAAELHGPLDLGLEVVEVGDRRRGDVGDAVGHGDAGKVLALSEDVARLGPDRLGRGGARRRRRRAGALHAGVHVGLVVVADEEHVVVALEHPRQAAEADVDRPAVAGLGDDADIGPPLHPQRRGDPGGDRGRVAEQRVEPRRSATRSPGRGWRTPRGSRWR